MPYDIKKLDTFPAQPGVYIMKSGTGAVLYVGKAKSLRHRVKQYFAPGGDGRPMIPFLIPKVEDIETIIVMSEKEALLLENTLIKKHHPKYNALLKDDKTFTALKLTKQQWPMLQLIRYKGKPKQDGIYFGPYTSAYSARATLDLLHKIFPLRQCSDQEFARRTRPCILYDMKRCIAPCVRRCTAEEYRHHVDRTIKFLKGQDKEILEDLRGEMGEAAESLNFEKAAQLRDTISQIENTVEAQSVDKVIGTHADALGIYREGGEVVICQLLFRHGKLVGSRPHHFSNIAQEDDELLESFIVQEYDRNDDLPREILLPIALPDAEAISEVLAVEGRKKISLLTPQKGEKRTHTEMARVNAEAVFKREKDLDVLREKTLLEMQDKLHLMSYPSRIECIDTSNLGGSGIVSSLVAFTDGKKDGSRYRKYKIRTVETGDDYAALREVLQRRYRSALEENDLPNLLAIDGGKGHLNAALKVLAEMNIITVDVIGIAKEDARHDRGMTGEQIFIPNLKDPILLRKTSPILFLLQQIRDEAHRVAITYQRKVHTKKTLKSLVDDIPGVGPARRKALLKHFGSVQRLKEASLEDLQKVPGLPAATALVIKNFFSKRTST